MAVKVRERKGAWWLYVDHKGRRKAKCVGVGPRAKKAATAAAEKIQAKLALGDLSVFEDNRTPAVTLREHVDNWLKDYVAVHLKAGTEEKYRAIMEAALAPDTGARSCNGHQGRCHQAGPWPLGRSSP